MSHTVRPPTGPEEQEAHRRLTALYQESAKRFISRDFYHASRLLFEAKRRLVETVPPPPSHHHGDGPGPGLGEIKRRLAVLHLTLVGALADPEQSLGQSLLGLGAEEDKDKEVAAKDPVRKWIVTLSRSTASDVLHAAWLEVSTVYRTPLPMASAGGGGGVDGSWTSCEIVSATLLLGIKLKAFRLARDIMEGWLGDLPDDILLRLDQEAERYAEAQAEGGGHVHGIATSAGKDKLLASYTRALDLYLLQVLPALGDLGYAAEFVEFNSVLVRSGERDLYLAAIKAITTRREEGRAAPGKGKGNGVGSTTTTTDSLADVFASDESGQGNGHAQHQPAPPAATSPTKDAPTLKGSKSTAPATGSGSSRTTKRGEKTRTAVAMEERKTTEAPAMPVARASSSSSTAPTISDLRSTLHHYLGRLASESSSFLTRSRERTGLKNMSSDALLTSKRLLATLAFTLAFLPMVLRSLVGGGGSTTGAAAATPLATSSTTSVSRTGPGSLGNAARQRLRRLLALIFARLYATVRMGLQVTYL